jgi:hypothetical protein
MAFSSHFKGVLSLNSASFEQGLTKAQGKVKSFNKELTGMFTRFLGATAIVSFGKSVLDSTAKLGDMSKRLGVSTDFLQKFNFAMEQSGVDSNGAQVGLQRFIRRIGTARETGGELKKTLDNMNISLNNTNGTAKSSEQLFLEFADGLGKISDPSAKLATAFKFLDSEGVAMIQTIGDGSGEFAKLGKQAEELGLIIDGKTITSLQDLDAELQKSQSKFKVLGAKILPILLKGLNLAVVGFESIIEVVKTSATGFELFGKTLKQYVTDYLEKAEKTFDLFVANVNASLTKLNPLASGKDVKTAEANLAKVEKAYRETANKTSDSFMQTRDKVLKKDTELAQRREANIKRLKQLSIESNNILKDGNSINLKDNKITEQSINFEKQKEAVLQRVLSTREDINTKISTQIERINALKNGGEEELKLLIQRQEAEKEISKLMQEGNMSREQAEAHITKLLELENQEKVLLQEIKAEEKEREEAKKKLSENNALVLKLQQEKQFAQEIKNLEEQINNARVAGNMVLADRLAQQKINLIAGQDELKNRDKIKQNLQDELLLLQDKRDLADAELQILNLIAQGRVDEANELQAVLKIQKDIQDIQNDLQIGEKEAIGRVEQRARLEKQIALDKINAQAQELKDVAVRELAEKNIHEARNADEKARIRRARKVQALEEDIVDLRERGTDFANKMADDLEKKKNGHLSVILDDETKADLDELQNEKLNIETDFDNQLKALDDRLKNIQKAEIDAQQKEQERLRKVQEKQTDLLRKAREAEETLKDKLVEVGDKAKDKLQVGFNSVLNKLQAFVPPKVEIDNEIDLSGLSSVLDGIPSAISNIQLPEFPEIPEQEPPIVNVEVDTDSLLTEQTGIDIKTALEGKFINQ